MSYKNNKASNRKVIPTQNNPYSDLIYRWIHNKPAPMSERYDTRGNPLYYVGSEKLDMLTGTIEEMKSLLEREKRKYSETGSPGHARNIERLVSEIQKAEEKLQIKEYGTFQTGGSNYGYPVTPRYDANYGSEDGGIDYELPKVKIKKKYPTLDFNDYDVYMSYYRTMGFYIPNGWKIDFDGTKMWWKDRPNSFKWRKMVLVYTGREIYQEFQYIPFFVGQTIRSTDYIFNERRAWFMYHTLAFHETVDKDLMDKMESALKRMPFDENEQFQVIQTGYSQDSYEESWNEGVPQLIEKYSVDPWEFFEQRNKDWWERRDDEWGWLY